MKSTIIVRTIAMVLLAIILIVGVSYLYYTGYLDGDTTTPPTTTLTNTTTTGTTTITTTTVVHGKVTIKAVDESGNLISTADIAVDGKSLGKGQVETVSLSYGAHTITWGSVSGYNIPSITSFLYDGTEQLVIGRYSPISEQKVTLEVQVILHSTIFGDYGLADQNVYIIQNDKVIDTGVTDAQGIVIFRLPTGTYTVRCTTVYGTQAQTLTLVADIQIQLRFISGGLSVLGLSDGESLGIIIIAVVIVGFVVVQKVSHKKRKS